MNTDDLIALNDEIAGMARAGLPLDQGLAALAQEMGKGRLQQVTATLAADLRAGHPLPEALDRQAGRLPPFYASLVAAGMRTGRIGDVLATLTVYARVPLRTCAPSWSMRSFVLPCVLVFGLILFGFLCFFVLPRFEEIFKDFGVRLPAITELALAVSQHPLQRFVIPVLAVVFGLIVIRQILRLTAWGRRLWARWIYAIPIAGTLTRSARLAAFTDLLAILIDHELPLPEAFRLAGEASSDPIMAGAAQQVYTDLSQGMPLGEVLRGRALVPEWVSWMTGLGERRGSLGKTLHQVAEMYRRQVDIRAALLRSVLPPFLIVCTAGMFVVLFVMAVMLPLIRLLETLSQ